MTNIKVNTKLTTQTNVAQSTKTKSILIKQQFKVKQIKQQSKTNINNQSNQIVQITTHQAYNKQTHKTNPSKTKQAISNSK